jgi:hypothetical protein
MKPSDVENFLSHARAIDDLQKQAHDEENDPRREPIIKAADEHQHTIKPVGPLTPQQRPTAYREVLVAAANRISLPGSDGGSWPRSAYSAELETAVDEHQRDNPSAKRGDSVAAVIRTPVGRALYHGASNAPIK